jgi:conjugative transposon TraM protein
LEQGLGISGSEENNSRDETATNKRKDKTSSKMEGKPEIVKKLEETNGDKFNTITNETAVDALLIRAMIDKTTHAHEGTRLRFKLLDDVSIKNVKLKRGSYLYGLVTGFVGQRVQASITSILIENKFIRVNLSVFDNDGMEGFYVPQSAFRDMIKDAGSQVMQNNISLDSGSGSELSGEAVALQALQNAYQSASSAVSANIRKNKARIKYNTIVYLINKETSE